MQQLVRFLLLAALTLTIPSRLFAQTLRATLPPTKFEITFKAPLFRSASDTAKAAELFLPAGSTTSVVGVWNSHWAVVRNSGYLYLVPVQRLKGFDLNTLPKPKSEPAEPAGAPDFPINLATKLITYEGVVEVPGATRDQLYDRALEWMARTYQSANDMIQIKDKEQGKLLAKGGLLFISNELPFTTKAPYGYVVHTQTIYVKDGRYKYILTGFRHEFISSVGDRSMGALEQATPPKGTFKSVWYEMLTSTDVKTKAMIGDLEQAMQAKGKDPSKF